MPENQVRCVLISIHGIGNQKPTWSRRFDSMLKAKLSTLPRDQQRRFVSEAVHWADLSRLPGMGVAVAPGSPPLAAGVAFRVIHQEYTQYLLGADTTTIGAPAAFDWTRLNPTKIIAKLKTGTVKAADSANDVANYVTNNSVRAQIQHSLSDKLFKLHARYPKASLILGSHSQGTIISYDVLRLTGFGLPRLKTWVTMGSPLGWYLNLLRWGDDPLSIQAEMSWLNFYDDEDRIGRDLARLVTWPAPVPRDVNVDNKGKGLDPHDHWHNPDVVERFFQLIRRCVT